MLSCCGGTYHAFHVSKFTVLLSLTWFLSYISYIPGTEARNCYHCKYAKGIESHFHDNSYPVDDSCETENPSDALAGSCEYLQHYHDIPGPKHEQTDDEDAIKPTYSCIKVIYEGRHIDTGIQVTMIVRSCISSSHEDDSEKLEKLPDVCYNAHKDKIEQSIKEEHVKLWLRENALDANAHFDTDVDVTVCACDKDLCNGTIRTLSVAPALLFICIFCVNWRTTIFE